ncbi:putative protein N(5)-glutamine methyltransferase [Nonomuraea typhae]|uniref:putative protein N(5)-glutamine methyltransferase n=1 Tax=Nonomuraea typhae TaxID=2603600 RepID=UPI0012FB0717|nr:putative protein N(5)-glutamine methyltransferase [Nonomuraea typhae]
MSPEEVVTRLRAAGCVFAEDEAELILSTAATPGEVAAMVGRRAEGYPLEQVVGWAEFCGLRVRIGPGVFVPRRRTEFLVRQAAKLVPSPGVILDLCCGSGALGKALVSLTGGELHAADVEPAAVACARENLAGNVYEGDLFDPLPEHLRTRVDVLLANVPYVPTADIGFLPQEAREHEPLVTLDGGPDGLDVLRRVTAEAPRWLAPGGHLLFETGERQAEAARAVVEAAGLRGQVLRSAEFHATVIVGVKE